MEELIQTERMVLPEQSMDLNKYLNENGVFSEIYSFNDNKRYEDFVRDEFTTVKLFPRSKYFKSKRVCNYILSEKVDFDIVHFSFNVDAKDKNTILSALKKEGIPYTITTRTAYTPDRIDSLKKTITINTFERKNTCLMLTLFMRFVMKGF